MLTSFIPPVRCHYQEAGGIDKLSRALTFSLQALNPNLARPVVVVAIGTDRSTGDSLGPLVGSKLSFLSPLPPGLFVYGTLEEPVHATNLVSKLQLIKERHQKPLLIAIDACLGKMENIGWITFSPGPLKPGAGVNKSLPPVGDFHLTGTVNVGGYFEYFVLQNTRLSLVLKIAEVIALIIHTACKAAYTCPSFDSAPPLFPFPYPQETLRGAAGCLE